MPPGAYSAAGRIRPIRNVDAGDLIELTLVVAVATVIVIRTVLELAGYPKLAGGGLHIAHVLYGGINSSPTT